MQSGGTLIHIQTSDGRDILTFAPSKDYQSVMLSSPDLANGVSYVGYSGGSSSATSTDGLYSGGVYTPGSEVASFTTSATVTTAGAASGGFGHGGGGGWRP